MTHLFHHNLAYAVLLSACLPVTALSQCFRNTVWKEKNQIGMKYSQLFYEANAGINVNAGNLTADFIYFAFGYGKATRRNAWRKFLPVNAVEADWSDNLKQKVLSQGDDGLNAWKIGVGWNHWINHCLGGYVQMEWCCITDLSDDLSLTEEEQSMVHKDKKTFIYNTFPVEAGLTVNLWQHWHAQIGVTWLWKESPLLTAGIGYAF